MDTINLSAGSTKGSLNRRKKAAMDYIKLRTCIFAMTGKLYKTKITT
jgi:hypothetical protein